MGNVKLGIYLHYGTVGTGMFVAIVWQLQQMIQILFYLLTVPEDVPATVQQLANNPRGSPRHCGAVITL